LEASDPQPSHHTSLLLLLLLLRSLTITDLARRCLSPARRPLLTHPPIMAFSARFMLPFVLLLSLHITARAQNATSPTAAAAAANGNATTAVVIAPTNGTQPARNASSTNTTTPATAICPLDTAAIFQADFEPVKAACGAFTHTYGTDSFYKSCTYYLHDIGNC
jgi:hypothetical protein